MAWAKKVGNSAGGNYGDIVGSDASDVAYEMILRFSLGTPAFVLNSFTTNDRAIGTAINNNVWYHLAGVYNGSTIMVYVNGALNASVVPTGSYGAFRGIDIGGFSAAAATALNGSIDEVMIFNTSLTSEQISSIYALGRNAGSYSNESLISHWRADDSTANDDKGLNNGTLTGDATVINEGSLGRFDFLRDGVYAKLKAGDYLYGSPYYFGNATEDIKKISGNKKTGINANWGEVEKESFPFGWLVYDELGKPELSVIGGIQWLLRLGQQHNEQIIELQKRLETAEAKLNKICAKQPELCK
jgi:hypothetical protein